MKLPSTMASVLVAFRSFLTELFSRFFLLALLALYIVNLEVLSLGFLSFLTASVPPPAVTPGPVPTLRTLGLRLNCAGKSDPVLLSFLSPCLLRPLVVFLIWVALLRGGGEDEVEEDGAEVVLGFGLGLEFPSIVLLTASSRHRLLESLLVELELVKCALATTLKNKK